MVLKDMYLSMKFLYFLYILSYSMLVLGIRVHCILLILKLKICKKNKQWLNFIKKSVDLRLPTIFKKKESKGSNHSPRHNLNLKG